MSIVCFRQIKSPFGGQSLELFLLQQPQVSSSVCSIGRNLEGKDRDLEPPHTC
jgi:hypothetical protein